MLRDQRFTRRASAQRQRLALRRRRRGDAEQRGERRRDIGDLDALIDPRALIQRGPYIRIGTWVSYGCGEPCVVFAVLDVNIQFGFSATWMSPETSGCHDFAIALKNGASVRLRLLSSARV